MNVTKFILSKLFSKYSGVNNFKKKMGSVCNLICYANGRYQKVLNASTSITDSGFIYGHAVFEIMNIGHSKIRCFGDHLERLSSSAKSLNIKIPSKDFISQIIQSLVEKNKCYNGSVIITISHGPVIIRDYKTHPNPYGYSKQHYGAISILTIPNEQNKNIFLESKAAASTVLDARDNHFNIKCTSRISNVIFSTNAKRSGFDISIICDPKRGVLETPWSNIIILDKNNQLKTPKQDGSVLNGITLKIITKILKSNKIKIIQTKISIEDLVSAKEVLATSTTRGVVAITKVDRCLINNGKPGLMYRKILSLYSDNFDKFCEDFKFNEKSSNNSNNIEKITPNTSIPYDPSYVFVNGKYKLTKDAKMPILDSSFCFGHSVFEVTPIISYEAIYIDDHYSRLVNGCKLSYITPPKKDLLLDVIKKLQALNGVENGILNIQVTYGPIEKRSYCASKQSYDAYFLGNRGGLVVQIKPIHKSALQIRSLKATILKESRMNFFNIKSTSRSTNLMQKSIAESNGYDIPIIINSRTGFVSETPYSNVFILNKKGVLKTPIADSTLLDGLSKKRVLKVAKLLKIQTKECNITEKDLMDAEEVFLSSVTRFIQCANSIDGKKVGKKPCGDIATKIREYYYNNSYNLAKS